MTDYAPDTFTENDVLTALDQAGKKYKNGSRYILAQCPTHDDVHESVQIYKDDWFVNCHAGCGRYHITKAFPQLRPNNGAGYTPPPQQSYKEKKVTEHVYQQFDQMEYWKTLPLIPRDHNFKGIDLDILDSLGWRWVENLNSYFIPYFSRSKETIPFSQLRHLSGDRRFTFLKDAKPTMYGTFNLYPGESIFLVEGASDAAVLDFCAVPWIAAPSAASGELVRKLAMFCKENDIQIVYAGDNDAAGDKLREALDTVMSYRVKQPPKPYKDWGEFLEGAGYDAVVKYAHRELFPMPADLSDPNVPIGIRELWEDAETYEGEIPDFTKKEEPQESKEQSVVLPMEF